MYPSGLRMDILPNRVEDPAIPRRLLASVLSALKSSGSKGVHCELSGGDKFMIDFYAKLGLFPITTMEEPRGDAVYLGRPIQIQIGLKGHLRKKFFFYNLTLWR